MASEKQVAANRRNGAKGGPKTPRGKAHARMNALKHGLRAEHVVIPGEDPEEFEALRRSLEEHYQPVGPVEVLLVERITVETHRLIRATLFETGILRTARYETERDGACEEMADKKLDKLLAEFAEVYLRSQEELAKLSRYETTIFRRLRTLRQDLEAAQARRKSEAAQAARVIEGSAVGLNEDPHAGRRHREAREAGTVIELQEVGQTESDRIRLGSVALEPEAKGQGLEASKGNKNAEKGEVKFRQLRQRLAARKQSKVKEVA